MPRSGPYLGTTYVHLGPNGTALPLPVMPTCWEDLDAATLPQSEGRLVSSYHFPANWDAWEKHPAGEELVSLLTGVIELILATGDQETRYTLATPGEFVIVPRDTWHTADVPHSATALFITAGDGTEHRARGVSTERPGCGNADLGDFLRIHPPRSPGLGGRHHQQRRCRAGPR